MSAFEAAQGDFSLRFSGTCLKFPEMGMSICCQKPRLPTGSSRWKCGYGTTGGGYGPPLRVSTDKILSPHWTTPLHTALSTHTYFLPSNVLTWRDGLPMKSRHPSKPYKPVWLWGTSTLTIFSQSLREHAHWRQVISFPKYPRHPNLPFYF